MVSSAMDWLLEEDTAHPGVRYFALTRLLDRPPGDTEVMAARQALMRTGPVPAILAAQDPAGYWEKPGAGYNPKYRSTVWSIIYLAQLGADPADPRVRAGGDYLLSHALTPAGVFSASATLGGNVHCLAGNLAASLLDLGFERDEGLRRALEWMARYVTGEGIAPAGDRDAPVKYLKSATCAPGFCCSANNGYPCAWGAVKVLRALARVPQPARTPALQSALDATIDFLLSVDPATAGYPTPTGGKPSSSWFRFGFPLFYVTDVLQIAEALAEAGCGRDPRLAPTHDLILGKRGPTGRWTMDYSYQGKTWADAEAKGRPSKWVTMRALAALKP